MYILNTEGSDRILLYPFESLLFNLTEHVELTSRCGEGKVYRLNALRWLWHIDPRDPPAPQSLPHNHDLHVRHPRRDLPAPSLFSPRSVHGVTRVVPAPKGIKPKIKFASPYTVSQERRKCRPDLFPSILRFFPSFLTLQD